MKKATAFTPELFPAPTPENITKYLGSGSNNGPQPTVSVPAKPKIVTPAPSSGPVLKSQKIFEMMGAYLDRGEGKPLISKVAALFSFEITPKKGEPPVKIFTIDLKNGQGKAHEGKSENPDATFTMTDDDFESVCLGKLNPQTAFLQVI